MGDPSRFRRHEHDHALFCASFVRVLRGEKRGLPLPAQRDQKRCRPRVAAVSAGALCPLLVAPFIRAQPVVRGVPAVMPAAAASQSQSQSFTLSDWGGEKGLVLQHQRGHKLIQPNPLERCKERERRGGEGGRACPTTSYSSTLVPEYSPQCVFLASFNWVRLG